MVALGAYFGVPVDDLVTRLLGEQLADGGWNCEAENGSVRSSFHSTICVLEGLLEYERAGGAHDVAGARGRAEEYLLERRLFRRLSTGEVADEAWLGFSFPPQWHYDVLRGLDHLRAVGGAPDERVGEALDLVRAKRSADGTWPLENTHRGAVHFAARRRRRPAEPVEHPARTAGARLGRRSAVRFLSPGPVPSAPRATGARARSALRSHSTRLQVRPRCVPAAVRAPEPMRVCTSPRTTSTPVASRRSAIGTVTNPDSGEVDRCRCR